jgi:hypothetical protein
MTGEPGGALSFIPGLAHSPAALSLRRRTHRHGVDPVIERTPRSAPIPNGNHGRRSVGRTSDKCFGYKNQIIRAHRGAGDSALARRHASYSNLIVGRIERRSQVRAGCRIRSGAAATLEVRSEKRLGRERPGRFAHKPTKPEAQFPARKIKSIPAIYPHRSRAPRSSRRLILTVVLERMSANWRSREDLNGLAQRRVLVSK